MSTPRPRPCVLCGEPTVTRDGNDPQCAPCFAKGMGYAGEGFRGVRTAGEYLQRREELAQAGELKPDFGVIEELAKTFTPQPPMFPWRKAS